MTHLLENWSGWLRRRTAWWLGAVSLFFLYDIGRDLWLGEIDAHLPVEIVISAVCIVVLFMEIRRNLQLSGRLRRARAQSQRLSGEFAEYVRGCFARWNLSRSEQEVAWLVLKGFSFAEIAMLRSVQEKTVRQQATSIYAKSSCKSRSEFFAHFIEDLLTGEHAVEQAEPTTASVHTQE